MADTKQTSILELYKKTFSVARKLTGNRYLIHLFLAVMGSLLEIVGLATILPLIGLIFNQKLIEQNKYISKLYQLSGADSVNDFVLYSLIGIAVFFILKNLFHVAINYYQMRFCFYLSTLLSKKNLEAFLGNSYSYFTSSNSGYLWQQIMVVPGDFSSGMILSMYSLTGEFLVLLLIILSLAIFNIKTFILLGFTIIPITFLFYNFIKKKSKWIGDEYNRLQPEANKNFLPTFQNYIDIKLMQKEKYFISNILFSLSKINKNNALNQTLGYIPYRLIELTILLGIICIFIVNQVLMSDLKSLGLIIGIYTTAAFRVLPSLNRIVTSMMRVRNCEYVFPVIDNALKFFLGNPTDKILKNQVPIIFNQTIEIKNVSYQYTEATENAIENISLTIHKGDCLGIVGFSGSGKTTLLRILLRLLQEQSGQLTVDGIKVDDAHLQSWWNLLGYVQQEVYILDGNVIDNIAFGEYHDAVNMEKLERSINLAGLKNFIKGLPKGLQTNLGELGAKISGGQSQRIGIARALYKDAEVFLFDEITSALDNETEKEILESIALLKEKGKTIIIISHRHSTLRYCNKIFKLEKGKISEERNHS